MPKSLSTALDDKFKPLNTHNAYMVETTGDKTTYTKIIAKCNEIGDIHLSINPEQRASEVLLFKKD